MWKEVDHPNVLRLLGFAFANDLPAFVADWMDRGTLRKYRAANSDLDFKSMVRSIKLVRGGDRCKYLMNRHFKLRPVLSTSMTEG